MSRANIEIQTGPDEFFYADWDLYSVLREEPEFVGIAEDGSEYELSPEQLTMVEEWFRKPENSRLIFEQARKAVAND